MRELIQKEIDGRLYEFEQFTTTVALKTLARLTKILGEPLTLGLAAIGIETKKPQAVKLTSDGVPPPTSTLNPKNLLDRELNTEGLAKAVRALIDRLDEDEVVDLAKRLTTQGVLCDHKQIMFDEHFRGGVSHLFKVLAAAVEAQYGNFFGAVTAGVTAQQPISVQR